MNKLFSVVFAAVLPSACFAVVDLAVAQDGASDDLKIKEIFVPAWDSQLLPDLPDKALQRAPLDGDIRFPQADGESPCELKEGRLNVPEGETSDISAKKVKEPEDANNQTRPNFSEHSSDGGETVLKGAEQTNALSRFPAFGSVDGDSEFASAASRVGSALETLSNALATIGAQDELNALEQDVRNWLATELDRQRPRRELTNAYKNALLILETNRALNSPEASELGKARVLRRLLDAELATETPDEARVLFFREKYYGEITRDFQENPSKRDEILLTALREEKASPRPQPIARYFLLPNWGE
ncbi:MAG: hypothetical protein J6X44_10285 [Thermoguttaceae bacterium]|nr:hypothetical protein [Thermoguttaceae bacterium]